MYDICCVGHITSDKIVNTKSTLHMPGGTALYFSCAVNKLDVNYVLVTALGAAEMEYVDYLRGKGIEVKVQPSAHTVIFENIYGENQDERTQNVLQIADTFTMEQLEDVEAKIFHLGPLLAGDFSTDLIKTLAAKGTIALDVQGYLRKVVNQKVYLTDWADKKNALQYIDVLKADVAELAALSGYDTVADGVKFLAGLGVKEAVITNGSRGSTIYSDDVFYEIPAYHPEMVVDATGCGDTYMAGYLYKRIKDFDLQQSGEFAAAMAGLKTMSPGPFVGTEAEVMKFLKDRSNN
ncbi:PfkB family carbohydrate kinase [Mucilaginibacter sp. UR6-11]|uniref:PfkB family carbohydrate kinase n=1 Tax=Mucilaginibacter sp. UR6-11 TaxID=1435644 RepID=UPI001E4464D0|nr:PfkB family carbohydrate kinase [Mucilaginibacter sp. UR6-11]MCC8424698.1 PfkB family carbohydrate kinase [Mucilaginibacter sp. UR6-11]